MSTATTSAASSTAATPRNALRIVFLAARPATVAALQSTLGNVTGFELHLAVDPEEAEAMARRECPDMVLIDLPWAGRAGQRLIERLRAANVTARVAVLGDLYGTRAREAAKRIGANGFTPDPASPDLLKVMRALAGTKPRMPASVTEGTPLELAVA